MWFDRWVLPVILLWDRAPGLHEAAGFRICSFYLVRCCSWFCLVGFSSWLIGILSFISVPYQKLVIHLHTAVLHHSHTCLFSFFHLFGMVARSKLQPDNLRMDVQCLIHDLRNMFRFDKHVPHVDLTGD